MFLKLSLVVCSEKNATWFVSEKVECMLMIKNNNDTNVTHTAISRRFEFGFVLLSECDHADMLNALLCSTHLLHFG